MDVYVLVNKKFDISRLIRIFNVACNPEKTGKSLHFQGGSGRFTPFPRAQRRGYSDFVKKYTITVLTFNR
jgi:hypothetical protein